MNSLKIDPPLRMFFAMLGIVIWLGVWLTGFGVAHWLFYIPAVFLSLAAITGLCPGVFMARKLVGKENS